MPEPDLNPGLVRDCAVLLEAADVLVGSGTHLNWSPERPITQWEGVSADSAGVRELDLSYRQLAGKVPGVLGALARLSVLDLRGNRLTSEIPPALAKLQNLRELRLQDNRLTGRIPAELGALSGVGVLLDLRDNHLRGEIPLEILEVAADPLAGIFPWVGVRLRGNQFSGCLPLSVRQGVADVGYPLHSDFHQLGLRYCQCPAPLPNDPGPAHDPAVGVDGIPLWSGLAMEAGPHRLSFSLVVDVPEEGSFLAMERGPYYERGGIALTIHEVNSASFLTMDMFSGEEHARWVIDGPSGCEGNPSALFDQLLASAREQPPYAPARPEHVWEIEGSTFLGDPPPSLEGGRTYWLTQHLILDVPDGTRLTAHDRVVMADPGGAFFPLDLVEEQSGAVLILDGQTGWELGRRGIPEGAEGQVISVLFDAISASIRLAPTPECDEPETAPDCATLLAAKESLAGSAILNWSEDTPLGDWEGVGVNPKTGRVTVLDLEGSGLTGQIPPVLGRLSGLRILVLAGNELTGKIPRELGALAKLRSAYLSGNKLTGEIPRELASLAELDVLYLNHNDLTGAVPREFGTLRGLHGLYLHDNELTGEIPPELGEHIKVLRLENNRLTGAIPPGFGSPYGVRQLNLSGNRLAGCIPASLQRIGRFGEAASNPDLQRCE